MPVATVDPDGAARSAERRHESSRAFSRPRRRKRRAFPSGFSARLRPDPFGRNRAPHPRLCLQYRRKCHTMKIASFKAGSTATWGLVTDAGLIDAGKRLQAYPTLRAWLTKGAPGELNVLMGERPDYKLAD